MQTSCIAYYRVEVELLIKHVSDASRVRAKTKETATKEVYFFDSTSHALCLSQANSTAATIFSQLALILDE